MTQGDRGASVHDQLFKEVFEQPRHAASFLRTVLPAEFVDRARWDSLRVESGELGSFAQTKLRTDILFSVRIANQKAFVYVLVEHQSSTDPHMPLRMLGYLVALWQRLRRNAPTAPPALILPVVVYHDRRPWSGAVRFQDLFDMHPMLHAATSRHLPDFEFILVDLALIDEKELRRRALTDLARIALWLLKTARDNPRLAEDLQAWFGALQRIAAAPNGVAAAVALLHYATRVGDIDPDHISNIAARLGPAIKEAYMTGAERLIERGRAEGRAELVIKQLEFKFGNALSPAVRQRVRHSTIEEVDRYAQRVLSAERPEDIFD